MPDVTEWTPISLTIPTTGGETPAIGFTTPSVPGLAVTKRTYEDGVVEWTVTHLASGRGVNTGRGTRCEMPRRELAERYLLGLRDVTDWTAPMDELVADRAQLVPKVRLIREAVFGADTWEDNREMEAPRAAS